MRATGSAARSRSHRSHTQLAGRPQPPCFLGHPAQLFGDQADIKGVLGVEIMPGSIVGAPGSAAIAEVIWEGAGVGLVRVRS